MIGLPLLAGLTILLLKPRFIKLIAMGAPSVTLLISLSLWQNNTFSNTIHQVTPNVSFLLAQDNISSLFLVLVQLVFLPIVMFALEYHEHDKKAHRILAFTILCQAALNGLCLSANLLTTYLFFEMITLTSFPMILHASTSASRRAAFVYLGYSITGAACIFSGLLLGSPSFLQAYQPGGFYRTITTTQSYAWLLIVIGFSCKAGMFPLQSWLPIAHPEAPSPASALLSGINTKAGILGILRVTYFVVGAQNLINTPVRNVMLTLSLITVFLGSMLAFKEKLLKRRLAFSSISQLSYVIFGMMLMTSMAFEGAILQVWFHAAAKITLFLVSGAILHYTGNTKTTQLLGIGKQLPWVMGCFSIAALSLIGIPPLGGFVAKWFLAEGALLPQTGFFGWLGVIVLMISALLTAGYLLPILSEGFFPGKDYVTPQGRKPGWKMHVSLTLLSIFLLVGGLFPNFLLQPIQSLSALLF